MKTTAFTLFTLISLLLALHAPLPAAAQDDSFDWSWEEIEPAGDPDADGFEWSWEDDEIRAEVESAPTRPAAPAPASTPAPPAPADPPVPAATSGPDSSAYHELLQENLDLRRHVNEMLQNRAEVQQENRRLTAEINDMELRLTEFVQLIQELRTARDASNDELDLDRVVELQTRLDRAEEEKLRMQQELQEMQGALRTLRTQQQEAQTLVDRPQPQPAVQPGSDLFREVEKENALLKQKIDQLDQERRHAITLSEQVAARNEEAQLKAQELAQELAATQAAAEEKEQRLSSLLKRMPQMEEELSGLEQKVEQKDSALSEQTRELEQLRMELERREYRLEKAERMAELLERARREVEESSIREKRDMHYNMAVIYAREGRHLDAEREYLNVLKLDPTDADTHYNLGILYEDHLKDDRKAAMHYQRYIKLNPYGQDVDTVKSWLNAIEMRR